jgi:hypothetical protein
VRYTRTLFSRVYARPGCRRNDHQFAGCAPRGSWGQRFTSRVRDDAVPTTRCEVRPPLPTALLIAAAFAICVVLPGSASVKEHRSASVKREFPLTHPFPSGRTHKRRVPGYVKDHVLSFEFGTALPAPQRSRVRASSARRPYKAAAAPGRLPRLQIGMTSSMSIVSESVTAIRLRNRVRAPSRTISSR